MTAHFNPRLDRLDPYPFQRLSALLADVSPPQGVAPISLAAGEPQAAAPQLALDVLQQHLRAFNRYPPLAGIPELRNAAAAWLCRRFALNPADMDADKHLLPVAGTREGIFSLIQLLAVPNRTLVFANPFYQIYAGAAILGGMHAAFLPAASGQALAEAPPSLWQNCSVLVLCSPHNPTGVVLQEDDLKLALELADRHDLVLVADECYSDLYLDESAPPAGLLGACRATGRTDWRNCVVLHSLSKRSSLAGMRSGFAAGDANILARYLDYRNYHGTSIPVPIQYASAACWQDEQHTAQQREGYRNRFAAFDEAAGAGFACPRPAGGFYYWMPVPAAWRGDDEAFVCDLWRQAGVKVVPGSYLSHTDSEGNNPGAGHVRLALVAEVPECAEAGKRIGAVLATHIPDTDATDATQRQPS